MEKGLDKRVKLGIIESERKYTMYRIDNFTLRGYALLVPRESGLYLEPILGTGELQQGSPSKGEAIFFPSYDKAREMAHLLALECELWAVDVPSAAQNRPTQVRGAVVAPQITPVQALRHFVPEKPWG